MERPFGYSRLVAAGGAIGLVLMIAAVWASDASTATSLALTAVLVLIAAAILASARPPNSAPLDSTADQRERMRDTTP